MKKNGILLLALIFFGLVFFVFKEKDNNGSPEIQEYLHIYADGQTDFVVTNPVGDKLGYDPLNDKNYSTMSGGYDHSSNGTSSVEMYSPNPKEGKYVIEIFGNMTSSYTIDISAIKNQGAYHGTVNGIITDGGVAAYSFVLQGTKNGKIEIKKE